MRQRISKATLWAAVVLGGCGGSTVMHLGETDGGSSVNAAGASGSSATGTGGSDTTGTTDAGPAEPACALNAGQSVPLALTNAEWDHTVRDLLGDTSATSTMEEFTVDPPEAGFRRELAPVDMHREVHYWKAALDLAQNAVGHLAGFLPCDPAVVGETACATQFIATFGRRAFRRPLTTAESSEMLDSYAQGRMGGDFASGIRTVMGSMLTSPRFYEVEQKGTSPGLAPLDPFRLASRLSYFIYRSMPDAPLLDAAEGGKLLTKADIEREARRMLADPKAHDGVIGFFSEWLSLDRLATTMKDPSVLANFDALKGDMATETIKFVESIFYGDGQFKSLLQSSTTWVNGPLADLYAQAGVVGDFQQVTLNPKVRAGILTQASFLSMTGGPKEGSPTLRGLFVRDKVLCQLIPSPPPNTPPLPEIMPGQTNRERYAATITNASCAACHQMMDRIGDGFEEFDTVGRYRTMDNGQVVDASGQLVNVPDTPEPFTGAVELASKLANSTMAQECAAKQWFRFALSRAETDEDACSITAAENAIESSGNLRDLVVAITTSDSFRYARW